MNTATVTHKKDTRPPKQIWWYMALLSAIWLLPLFLPDSVFQSMGGFGTLFVIWVVAFFIVGRLQKQLTRRTSYDAILYERSIVAASFTISLISTVVYAMKFGFDTTMWICIAFVGTVALAMIVSIILHLRNAKNYFHGVSKEELIQ